jgi:hypothetical protein
MSTLIKLIALAAVVVLLAPIVGANTEVGRVVGAALEDAAAFCERRPEACHQTAEIARDTRTMLIEFISDLRSDDSGTLTEEDRALTPPADPVPPADYEAFSANNPEPRP